MTEEINIVVDLSLLKVKDFALIDGWAWGQASFFDVLPVLEKCVTNGVDVGELPLPQLREVMAAVREASKNPLGN